MMQLIFLLLEESSIDVNVINSSLAINKSLMKEINIFNLFKMFHDHIFSLVHNQEKWCEILYVLNSIFRPFRI